MPESAVVASHAGRGGVLSRATTPQEFDALIAPLIPALIRVAGRLTSWDQPEDVVQEALAQAWRKRGQFDPVRGTMRASLARITINEALQNRRRHRVTVALDAEQTQLAATPTSDLDADIDLAHAINQLSARQQLAVDCFYFADLPISEVATIMDCSEGTVKSTLSDARARLRGQLEVER